MTAGHDETISDGSWEKLEEQARENEQLSLLTRELSLLNSNYRRVMIAYYIDRLSVKDISELIESGAAQNPGSSIVLNYPCFTKAQAKAAADILAPFAQKLCEQAKGRLASAKQATAEHLPERFIKYIDDMAMMYMYDEVGVITRLLIEEGWLVPCTEGMDPANIIVTE